jgi:Ca-activated chloride channel family protein
LAQIYALLDQLEPVEQEKQVFRPTHALFIWPLAAALALGALLLALPLLSPLPRTSTAHAR